MAAGTDQADAGAGPDAGSFEGFGQSLVIASAPGRATEGFTVRVDTDDCYAPDRPVRCKRSDQARVAIFVGLNRSLAVF